MRLDLWWTERLTSASCRKECDIGLTTLPTVKIPICPQNLHASLKLYERTRTNRKEQPYRVRWKRTPRLGKPRLRGHRLSGGWLHVQPGEKVHGPEPLQDRSGRQVRRISSPAT